MTGSLASLVSVVLLFLMVCGVLVWLTIARDLIRSWHPRSKKTRKKRPVLAGRAAVVIPGHGTGRPGKPCMIRIQPAPGEEPMISKAYPSQVFEILREGSLVQITEVHPGFVLATPLAETPTSMAKSKETD